MSQEREQNRNIRCDQQATDVPLPINGPLRESSGTTDAIRVANHQAIIRLETMIYQPVTSSHQETKARHEAMGPVPATTTGVGLNPHSKVNEPTNVK